MSMEYRKLKSFLIISSTLASSFGLIVAPTEVLSQPIYNIIDLGTLPGGNTSWGTGVNSVGQVAGRSTTGAAPSPTGDRAFFWDSTSGMQNLGVLPGAQYSWATDINDSGQVVGGNGPNGFAFIWDSASGMQNLGALPGGSYSSASAVNNSGMVAGQSHVGSTERHAFLYSGGLMTDLGTLGGRWSEALSINNTGQVVGRSSTAEHSHAFIWDSSAGLQDLGTFGSDNWSGADDINDVGQVVGFSGNLDNGGSIINAIAAMWDTVLGEIDVLGTLPGQSGSTASAINASGEVVGIATGGSGQQAFLYTSRSTSLF